MKGVKSSPLTRGQVGSHEDTRFNQVQIVDSSRELIFSLTEPLIFVNVLATVLQNSLDFLTRTQIGVLGAAKMQMR